MSRTQDDVVRRTRDIAAADILGFRRQVLVLALDVDHAREFLRPNADVSEWPGPQSAEQIVDHARDYFEFAIGKIEGHRGISAERSVAKLGEYAWLMGRDDVFAAMQAAPYPQYGAPKVRRFAVLLGWPWPDGEALARMASGQPCWDGCIAGCGR